MTKIKFIYFESCPNATEVMNILDSLDISFEIIEQNQLPAESPYNDYSSPTIIKGDQIIYGSKASGGACSLEKPIKDYFIKKLKQRT